jgi:hypothetical protein
MLLDSFRIRDDLTTFSWRTTCPFSPFFHLDVAGMFSTKLMERILYGQTRTKDGRNQRNIPTT